VLALVPGLVLVGAGIGLCFTPLTSTVLASVDPTRVGSASGAMSTMQQVGYALGVAITGVIFFGAADDGIGHAFELSLIQMAIVSAGIVVMSRLLPGDRKKESGHKTNVTQPQQIADTVVETAWSAPA
jgi:MFS family permease